MAAKHASDTSFFACFAPFFFPVPPSRDDLAAPTRHGMGDAEGARKKKRKKGDGHGPELETFLHAEIRRARTPGPSGYTHAKAGRREILGGVGKGIGRRGTSCRFLRPGFFFWGALAERLEPAPKLGAAKPGPGVKEKKIKQGTNKRGSAGLQRGLGEGDRPLARQPERQFFSGPCVRRRQRRRYGICRVSADGPAASGGNLVGSW